MGDPVLLRAIIVHRHGSRGPGESELSPWDNSSPMSDLMKNVWKENELEVITSIGHECLATLGKWCAKNYFLNNSKLMANKPLWRSSKSERGLESGRDLIDAFNSVVENDALKIDPIPHPYDISADYIFRPWKMFSKEAKHIKERIHDSQIWANKAKENEEFLHSIFERVKAKPKVRSSNLSSLWSTCYLIAVRECEKFWPTSVSKTSATHGEKCVLSNLISDDEWTRVNNLACWVWEERFLRSGYEVHLGFNLFFDIWNDLLGVDNSKNLPKHSLSIYSGHDYTLLVLFGIMKATNAIANSVGFGAYAILEVWSDIPANSKLVRPLGFDAETSDKRVLRVVYNSSPFYDLRTHEVNSAEVQIGNEQILRDYCMTELDELILDIRRTAEQGGLVHEPLSSPHVVANRKRMLLAELKDNSECHSVGTSISQSSIRCLDEDNDLAV